MIANTPKPPDYAVIFSSLRTTEDHNYSAMSDKMVELAKTQDGFLGVESAREVLGITVSYWKDMESIKKWKNNIEHTKARNLGREIWYKLFQVRIAKVEADYNFEKL